VIDPITGVSNQISFHAVWNIDSTGVNSVKLFTYFSSATAALSTSGGSQISSSQLTATAASADGSFAGLACNTTGPVGIPGATCPGILLASVGAGDLSGNNGPSGGTNATFSLSIPGYSGLRLAAGAYTGVLNAVVITV